MSAPSPDSHIQGAIGLMLAFAERTGLGAAGPQQRYLWTDAFAVCNFLGLARVTGDERHTELALRLIDGVHHTLGRHRVGDARAGWISGLGEAEGEAHPTRGGLRIGKKLPERPPQEPFDEPLEWERDGQYFHYLTKWMHALDLASRQVREPRFNRWARELAEVASRAFCYLPRGGSRPRMVWKMSIDLSRPLVPSMGHHDPLDGFITCAQLQTTASELSAAPEGPDLKKELAGFAAMLQGIDWVTPDPLGIGGLLMDAHRLEQLVARGALAADELLHTLLASALVSLAERAQEDDLRQPASRRLAFRELGLSIGLHAVELAKRDVQSEARPFAGGAEIRELLDALGSHVGLGSAIESFWLEPEHRQTRSWSAHRDINEVMLATSLVPEGCLVLPPVAG